MLRFQPDSWLEAVLRPVLLADPSAGIYYEEAAPDWRFLALLLVLALAFTFGRARRLCDSHQRRALLMLGVLFYVWTLTIGNGRYFIAGLLLVGPLLVMAWQWLPGGKAARGLLLLSLLALQAYTVQLMHRPGSWFLAGWREGPAVQLEPSPLRERPAVFLTLTMNAYAVLVPFFHPQARWANLGPQLDFKPGQPEHSALRALLDSAAPKYVVVPASPSQNKEFEQPGGPMQRMINLAIHPHRLAVANEPCATLRTSLLSQGIRDTNKQAEERVFWICAVRPAPGPTPREQEQERAMQPLFARMEAYCPRFFPPGQGITRRNEDHWVRYYPGTDTHVYVEDAGFVTYKYFRSFTPVMMGTLDEVLAGRMKFECTRMRGRYQPPWASN